MTDPVTYLTTSLDRSVFLDTLRWLPQASGSDLSAAVNFVDLFPVERRARLLAQGLELARHASAAGLDHLHAHFLTVAAHTVHIAHLLTGISYTVTAHAKDIYRSNIDWNIAAAIAERATAIVTVCNANKEHLNNRLRGVDVVRIYNGLGPQPPPAEWSERDPRLLLGVGRLVPKKGFELLIEAVAELVAGGHDVQAAIIGDGELRPELEARAAASGLADRVEFTGALTQDRVQHYMRTAAVLVAPCVVGPDGNQDALPTVLIESLGAGLPVVTTNVAGTVEIIQDGQQGRIVEPSGVSVAKACGELLNDRILWQQMSSSGPARLAETFDRAETAKQLVEVFARSRSQANHRSAVLQSR